MHNRVMHHLQSLVPFLAKNMPVNIGTPVLVVIGLLNGD
jgi:hypothetical protein